MQIYSGSTVKLYFVAVDGSDFTTRQTGLAVFGWTVYNSHDGGNSSLQSVSVTEVDGTNMAGVYHLSWTAPTISAGVDFEEGVLHITHSGGIAPITRAYTLSRPKITAGDTIDDSTVTSAVWGATAASHNTASSFGNLLNTQDASIADAVWTEPIDDHSGTVGSVAESLDGISNGNALTVAAIADAVWDEQIITGGHTQAGSFGHKLNLLGEPDDIADAVWDELTTGHSTVNSYGNIVANRHTAADVVTAMQAVANDFKADTTALLTTTAYNTSLPANFNTLVIGTGADIGKVTTSNPASGSGSNHTAADVAALILDNPSNLLVTNASGQVEASNMRGTDGANTVAPVDVSASVASILADTNELQQNQNNWLTATGFSTHSAGDIWDQAHASHTTDGTFGAHVILSTNQNHEVQVTGSNHIAADVHEFQPDVLTSAATDATFVAEVGSSGGGATAQEVYDLFTSGSNEDAFKADLTGIATSADVAAVSSGGTGLNQITVRVQDANSNALQGAVVNVDGTVLSLVTTPTGEVVFNLDAQDYTFDVSPPAGYSTPTSQALTVSGDATIIFTLTGGSTGGSVNWVG
jgi:hypothetical protein